MLRSSLNVFETDQWQSLAASPSCKYMQSTVSRAIKPQNFYYISWFGKSLFESDVKFRPNRCYDREARLVLLAIFWITIWRISKNASSAFSIHEVLKTVHMELELWRARTAVVCEKRNVGIFVQDCSWTKVFQF